MDNLVYELLSSDSVYSYVGHTSDVSHVELSDNQTLRPLFGFHGTCDECDIKVRDYIRENQMYVQRENLLTIYKLSCLDPSVPDTYIGKSIHGLDRMFGHVNASYVKETKVYSFIRSHGWWDNWIMTPMGRYWCDGNDDADRLEWYWWKKTNSQLNTAVPGISVVKRDCKKLKLSESELFKLYEKFEECIHRDYHGHELPPVFSKYVEVYLDCPAPDLNTYKRYKHHPTMYIHRRSIPQEDEQEKEEVDVIDVPLPTGSLFQMSNDFIPEKYIGFTHEKFTRKSAIESMKKHKSGKQAYLFMTMKGGGISSWRCELVTDKCPVDEYNRLTVYFSLNTLTHDCLRCLFADINGGHVRKDYNTSLPFSEQGSFNH
jgi:hypothetical protein